MIIVITSLGKYWEIIYKDNKMRKMKECDSGKYWEILLKLDGMGEVNK